DGPGGAGQVQAEGGLGWSHAPIVPSKSIDLKYLEVEAYDNGRAHERIPLVQREDQIRRRAKRIRSAGAQRGSDPAAQETITAAPRWPGRAARSTWSRAGRDRDTPRPCLSSGPVQTLGGPRIPFQGPGREPVLPPEGACGLEPPLFLADLDDAATGQVHPGLHRIEIRHLESQAVPRLSYALQDGLEGTRRTVRLG